MRHRSPMAIALTAVVALTPLLALPAFAATAAAPRAASAATTGDPVVTGPKVVIVVGATEGTTASYRADADTIAAEALKYTPNVVKLYSPNATWSMVKAAAQGASIFVYLGHGYGYPSPYRAVLSPDVQDGMGLNTTAGVSDSDKKYYGEDFIASDIRLAKDAIVLLNHLCYSAGSSEAGDPEPTVAVARERVDNFASGFIKAGARTVIAQSWTSGVTYMIRSIFTTDQSILKAWENAPNKQGHVQPFVPVRNPAFEARLDPDTATTGYHRSIVSATGHTTAQIRSGSGAAQASTAAPALWSVDGPTAITPNADGVADRLNLLARFSEDVSWNATIRNAGGDAVRTMSGSGHQAALSWSTIVNAAPAPAGDYTWNLTATDAGGGALEQSGGFSVAYPAVPTTGVPTFTTTTPAMTTVGTINYSLVFASPVTGLAKSDFTRTGNAPNCVLGTPVAAGPLDGTTYTLAFTGCSSGTVGLYLNSGAVQDAALVKGPAGPIIAPTVTVDNSAPTVATAKPVLRTGLALTGASSTQGLLSRITWTGKDAGSGIVSYDVQRSYDGATFTTIAGATTATQLNVTMNPGHTYRFRIRARDAAGNVGAWSPSYTWYPALTQQSSTSLTWTGSWTSASNSQNSGGSAASATTPGASVTYAFSGRAIAWVTTLRPDAGEVQVWVDDALVKTIDTRADATSYRQIVYSRYWSSYGAHTIKLVVVGTLDRPLATLDAFEVIR